MTDISRSRTDSPALASRVALFGRVWLLASLLGTLAHVLTSVVLGDWHELFSVAFLVHAASCLVPLGMWLACRSARDDTFARVVDVLGSLASTAMLAWMGRLLALQVAPDPAGLAGELYARIAGDSYESFATLVTYATSLLFTLRSALVPSRASHTVLLGVGMGATLLTVFLAGYHAPEGWAGASRANLALSTAVTWSLAVVVCGALSAIIHGLHRQLAEAKKLGQYTLLDKLGEGGMGAVYRAEHAMLRRPTAIKLLRRDRVGEEAIARFEREVQITAQLTHPNTITVYDYGRTPEGIFYYAMELLHGISLQTLVEEHGAQPAERVVRILQMVAGALAEAHDKGLVHRDVKPANIMLGRRGNEDDFATVLDFGLVRELERGDAHVTLDDKIVGTPMYLAPEAIRGAQVDARSDLYALGAVGYFLLTGRTVFDGASVVEVCGHHLHSEPVPPSQRLGVPQPPALEALLLRCLAKDPAARPSSAGALLNELAALRGEG